MNEEQWNELEKIDELRERMGVSYGEARQALELAHGDLVQALIYLETKQEDQGFKGKRKDILSSLSETIANLNHTRVNITKDHRKVLSVSAPLGMALAYTIWRNRALRVLGIAGLAGSMLSNIEFEIERPNSKTTVNLHAETEEGHCDSQDEEFAFAHHKANEYMI